MAKKIILVAGTAAVFFSLTACASTGSAARAEGGQLMFEDFDINGDGGVSQTEFVEVVPYKLRNPERIFGKLDTDGDGKISKAEFEARRKAR